MRLLACLHCAAMRQSQRILPLSMVKRKECVRIGHGVDSDTIKET